MVGDERFKKGVELFNREEFYECHEVIEKLWFEAKGDKYRNLYKGVIQAAVALHHLKRGNLSGAKQLFKTSTRYLSPYRPQALGLCVEKLIKDMKTCFEKANKGLLEDQLIPKVKEV